MTENMDVRLKEVVDTLQTNCYLQEDMDIGLKMGRVGPYLVKPMHSPQNFLDPSMIQRPYVL